MPEILVVEDEDDLKIDLVDFLALKGFQATERFMHCHRNL
jgi:hypothetical protein